jgi:hypothetical protein
MDMDRESAGLLFAAVAILFGCYGLFKGKITYGPEGGDDSDDRELTGSKATLVSCALIFAGVVTLFSTTYGLCLLVLAVLLPWVIDR